MQNPPDHSLPADRNRLTAAQAEDVVRRFRSCCEDNSEFTVLWSQTRNDFESPCITFGFPDLPHGRQQAAGLQRLVCWPNGLCRRTRVGILSSRVSAKKHTIGWWYDLLRTAVLRVAADVESVTAIQETATYEPLARAARLFGVPLIDVSITDETVSETELIGWLTSHGRPADGVDGTTHSVWQAHVAPTLADLSSNTSDESGLTVPDRDRIGVTQTQRCCVLHCRARGNLYHLLIEQLQISNATDLHILLAQTPHMPVNAQKELIHAGAIPWLVDGLQSSEPPAIQLSTSNRTDKLTGGPLEQPEDWLCHWTRTREGAWPGESSIDYLDELILGCETTDRSALAALLRILDCNRILAAHIRGAYSAVSLTEVPLSEFRQRRVYRRHKRHYDFEPWGIAIRRTFLISAGAHPVRYGTPEDTAATDLWFQPATDATKTIDWTAEKEWRVPHHLDLTQLSADSVCVFVNELSEVDAVQSVCTWPVIVVP